MLVYYSSNAKMKAFLFLIFMVGSCGAASLLSKFRQSDYKIKDFRFEKLVVNENFCNVFDMRPFKYNRTTIAQNATLNFKKTLGKDLEAVVQGYKFLSNEYRPVAIRFQVNLCAAYDQDVIGIQQGLGACGNITECYFAKDTTYQLCNFVMDESRMPPFFPSGKYKGAIQLLYLNEEVALFNVYLEIYRPITVN